MLIKKVLKYGFVIKVKLAVAKKIVDLNHEIYMKTKILIKIRFHDWSATKWTFIAKNIRIKAFTTSWTYIFSAISQICSATWTDWISFILAPVSL